MATSARDALFDPLLALGVAAAAPHVILATSILLLPLRHPVLLAKQLATLDVLSAEGCWSRPESGRWKKNSAWSMCRSRIGVRGRSR